jgi:hypothetical protein
MLGAATVYCLLATVEGLAKIGHLARLDLKEHDRQIKNPQATVAWSVTGCEVMRCGVLKSVSWFNYAQTCMRHPRLSALETLSISLLRQELLKVVLCTVKVRKRMEVNSTAWASS